MDDGRGPDAADWRNVASLMIRVILSDNGTVNNIRVATVLLRPFACPPVAFTGAM